jgi:ribosomal protein S18 acetylase RimI-like enzyme
MRPVEFPSGYRLKLLERKHPRKKFCSGDSQVDDWLVRNALQQQDKRLSVTRVLVDDEDAIAGYYTLATGQVDFGDLPPEISKRLPRRLLPVAVLAWLGVHEDKQGQGLGGRLLAQALRDAHEAGKTFAFVAVILDAVNDAAKAFYQRWDFEEMPGHPYRLFLSSAKLDAMMQES